MTEDFPGTDEGSQYDLKPLPVSAMPKYTEEDSVSMIDGDHPDFISDSVHDEIVDTGRWHIHRFQVFKRKSDGTFWGVLWSQGATEMQESEIDDPPFEVEGREVTTIEWKAKS